MYLSFCKATYITGSRCNSK